MVVGHQDQDVGRIQLLLRGTPKHRCDANSHRKEMQSAAASARQIRGWSHDQSMILHELYVPPNKERDAALRRNAACLARAFLSKGTRDGASG